MAVIDPSTVVLFLVTGVTAAVGIVAWRSRPQPGMTPLAVLMVGMSVWTGSVIVASQFDGYWLSRIAVNLVLTATAVTSVAFFAFTLEYTGREQYLQWPYPLLLAIEPVLVAVLTFTGDFHDLFWTDIYRDAAHYSGYTYDAAIGQYVHIWFAYLLMAVGVVLLLRKLLLSRAVHRIQTAAVLVAAVAPVAGNVLYVTDLFPLGQIIGFAVTGVALYLAITYGKLVDLTPVARATVLDELEVGVIVVDDTGQITDSNPYARDVLGVDDRSTLIGRSVSDVVGQLTDSSELDRDRLRLEKTVDVTIGGTTRTLQFRTSPLTDGLDRTVGRLILIEDITDRQRRREEIERRNEQLQEFASMVSHDVRNPLEVASGYVELMRQGRTPADDGGVRIEPDRLDETADALDRLETIVDDVLTLAREGGAATDTERVSLRSVARSAWDHVVTDQAQLIVGTNLHFSADRERLERLFENLFRNAVEHAGSDVTVSIGALEADRDGFYVADDGPGFPEDIRSRVFESGVTGAEEGTGFGLSIVEQIAEAHGWTVTTVEADDGGARFEIAGIESSSPVEPSSDAGSPSSDDRA